MNMFRWGFSGNLVEMNHAAAIPRHVADVVFDPFDMLASFILPGDWWTKCRDSELCLNGQPSIRLIGCRGLLFFYLQHLGRL
jgi:hypothetical protein